MLPAAEVLQRQPLIGALPGDVRGSLVQPMKEFTKLAGSVLFEEGRSRTGCGSSPAESPRSGLCPFPPASCPVPLRLVLLCPAPCHCPPCRRMHTGAGVLSAALLLAEENGSFYHPPPFLVPACSGLPQARVHLQSALCPHFAHGTTVGLYETLLGIPRLSTVAADSVLHCFFIERQRIEAASKSSNAVADFLWKVGLLYLSAP